MPPNLAGRSLSQRYVELILAERGIVVAYESIGEGEIASGGPPCP